MYELLPSTCFMLIAILLLVKKTNFANFSLVCFMLLLFRGWCFVLFLFLFFLLPAPPPRSDENVCLSDVTKPVLDAPVLVQAMARAHLDCDFRGRPIGKKGNTRR